MRKPPAWQEVTREQDPPPSTAAMGRRKRVRRGARAAAGQREPGWPPQPGRVLATAPTKRVTRPKGGSTRRPLFRDQTRAPARPPSRCFRPPKRSSRHAPRHAPRPPSPVGSAPVFCSLERQSRRASWSGDGAGGNRRWTADGHAERGSMQRGVLHLGPSRASCFAPRHDNNRRQGQQSRLHKSTDTCSIKLLHEDAECTYSRATSVSCSFWL